MSYHILRDGSRWVEWQAPGAPGWWTAVCDDPVIHVKARSLSLLRAAAAQAIAKHKRSRRGQDGKRAFGGVVEVSMAPPWGCKVRPTNTMADGFPEDGGSAVGLYGVWTQCSWLQPVTSCH